MMKTIRIHFCDFSDDFIVEQSFFYKILSAQYHLILDAEKPEYLIYSVFGQDYLKYDCVRIFYTGENLRPDFNVCDYAIGFDYMTFADRYLRFPSFAMDGEQFEQLTRTAQPEETALVTRKFCNFIYTNPNADPSRDLFFQQLSTYRMVDSLGQHLNNVKQATGARYASDWRESKVVVQQEYKFTIAFENSLGAGYTTEKLLHAFIANTIPIYWGNSRVCEDFNPDAFINVHDYESIDSVLDAVRRLDTDDAAYLKMLSAPPFRDNRVPEHLRETRVLEFFEPILEQPLAQARRRPAYGTTIIYETKLKADELMRRRYGLLERILRKLSSLCRHLFKRD